MTEEINQIIGEAKQAMSDAVEHLTKSYLNIRAGKANPQMLGSVFVDYYGSQTPLSQVASITTPDARTLSVSPWEKNMLQPIEKAIMVANLGLNPMNNGETIMINIPALTEERRKELAKQAKSEGEDTKISVRNARKDANNFVKKLDGVSEDLIKDAEERIQKLTDEYVQKIDAIYAEKEAEIMKV